MGRTIRIWMIWLLAVVAYAQGSSDYMFNRIDVEKGLSNSEIRCIYKSSGGYVWFGTRYGLNRYDGYEVVSYKQDLSLSSSMLNNDIADIQEDAEGRLWLSTRAGYTVFNPELEQFESNPQELIRRYAGTDTITHLYIDLGKNLWFVTPQDVRMYEEKHAELRIFPFGGKNDLSRGRVVAICQGPNRYWFLYMNGLLECMDAQTQKVISRDSTFLYTASTSYDGQSRLFSDSSANLWVYGFLGKGASCLSNDRWSHYHTEAEDPAYRLSGNIVTGISEDEKGQIWIAMDHGGLNILSKDLERPLALHHDSRNPNSLAQDAVKCLYIDNTGIVWVGTYKRGVCYYHESIFKFRTVKNRNNTPEMDVNCFIETPEGNIWIGTNSNGLLFYDRQRDQYTAYRHDPSNPNSPAGDIVVSMELDNQGRLWIGYFLSGMDCWDGKRFTHYDYHPGKPGLLPDQNVWKLLADRDNRLWIATLNGGVAVMDIATGERLYHFPDLGSVYSIIQRADGSILVGCLTGLYVFDAAAGKLRLFEEEAFAKVHLERYDINYIYEDSRRLLWIGTLNGLFVYNPFTQKVRLFTIADGLSSDMIQSILEDSEHDLWVATNRGLTLIKVSTPDDTPGYFFQMSNYDQAEGLQGEQFNFNAAYRTANGELMFGGSSGFNIFTPSEIHYNQNRPRVVLTDFQIYNESIRPGKEYGRSRVILPRSIAYTDEIELDYTDDYFTICFAALDYCMPEKSRYFYKLEGFNDQWLEAERSNRQVTYTNLNPGTYTFLVKAVNNDGIESEHPTRLVIHVHPPFWLTPWAYIIYGLIFACCFYAYWRYGLHKSEQRVKFAEEKMRAEHQHDLDEMRLRFFTNISHEFRTPLTLILTPLEELIKKVADKDAQELLHIVRRNAQQLLLLVNQLLDFRKLDVHGIHLQPSLGDLVLFIRDTTTLFSEAFERKHITCTMQLPEGHLYMRFDADKIGKVITNLLSNALKFTPDGGRITVSLERIPEQEVCISVEDSGFGIPPESLPHLFERFYQVEQAQPGIPLSSGSGIGLHLAQEFVHLHNGRIWAENVASGGSRFVFTLPLHEEYPDAVSLPKGEEGEAGISPEEAEPTDKNARPKLLVVDDNDDFRAFLSGCLRSQYTVLEARDGEEGLRLATEELPDMIVSDVMMPRMDGIAMCRSLKNDIRTSHIPLILLTAKSAEESKLEGLRAGADDYIPKPFNLDILTVKMHNLVEARRSLQQPLREPNVPIEPSRITVTSLDEKLLKRVMDDVEANISNPDFSVEELSRDVGMSRVNLYKKLLSITGKTPIEFIRLVRLKRAAQLLRESQMNVSEVAYEVGFNNPKYFRKYFKDEFGVLPSQFEKKDDNTN